MTDLGTDLAVLADGDLDPSFALLSGRALVSADVARRLQTDQLFYADEYGFDVRELVAARIGGDELAVRIEEAARRDDRVLAAEARVDGSRVALTGSTASGPFALVVSVAGASAAMTADASNR